MCIAALFFGLRPAACAAPKSIWAKMKLQSRLRFDLFA